MSFACYQNSDNNVEESYGLKLPSYIALQSTADVDLQANWKHSDSDDMFNVSAYWLCISDSFSANFAIFLVAKPAVVVLWFGALRVEAEQIISNKLSLPQTKLWPGSRSHGRRSARLSIAESG
ncbi:protein of unknown function [Shewanella benthica]|uniref:Uncharacterized protein n=1 Tax=Shewanella benthica TaxID=43661 RepID=A0A330M0U3_9GAMM|nr:protein of unknown function [Shewanella benthica]